LLVEHLARIAETADMDPGFFELLISARQTARGLSGFVIIALPGDSSGEIEHVKFDSRMTNQMSDISEPFGVLETKRISAVADGPVLALFAEHPFLDSTDARHRVADTFRARPTASRLTWHLKSLQAVRADFIRAENRIISRNLAIQQPRNARR
jgi:hypothetical protein